MARPKQTTEFPPKDFGSIPKDLMDTALSQQVARDGAIALLKQVAMLIQAVDANGKHSKKFCKLCPSARLRKIPCPHDAIWQLADNE